MTNAFSSRAGVAFQDLVSSMGGSPRFLRFSTRLSGDVTKGVRRGDHVVETVLLVGMSYLSMVKRSRDILVGAATNTGFAESVVSDMVEKGLADEITGVPVTVTDVLDAVNGTVRGRKGLVTAYEETLAGTNEDSTSDHVYEPLTVDGDVVTGCKVYVGAGDKEDPKAPVRGTVYLAGVTMASKVVEASPNGDKVPSRRGAVAMVKDYLEATLELPAARYRTYRILPGEAFEVRCGSEEFHATLGGRVTRGPSPLSA